MARVAGYAILAACVVWLGGCGTVYDTCRMSPWGETFRVYGGVRQDAEQAGVCAARVSGGSVSDLVQMGGVLLDLPLSAVADTLLLPITLRSGKPRPPLAPDTVPGQLAPTPTPEPSQQPVAGQ
jgi:uncharacterized protein YceK